MFYLNTSQTPSPSIDPSYQLLSVYQTTDASSSYATIVPQGGTPVNLSRGNFANYISSFNVGSFIPNGFWDMSIFASVTGSLISTNLYTMYYNLYGRTSLGVETLIGTSSSVVLNTTFMQQYTLTLDIVTNVDISAYSSLVVKLFGKNANASGGNMTITAYYQGPTTYSHLRTSFGVLGNTGPTGSNAFFTPATNIGSYLYWNGSTWTIGSSNVVLGNKDAINNQGTSTIGIGYNAGSTNQKDYAIAIGHNAGKTNQGTGAIAIGYNAGSTNQGTNSIAIGYFADEQKGNSIVINASNNVLSSTTQNALYINPIRRIDISNNSVPTLVYDASTSEVSYGTKTFVIDHPTNKNKYLVHACLEGPEGGVYYRGEGEITNNEKVTIELPDYAEALASDFTIQITPIYSGKKQEPLYTSRVKNNKFEVYGNNTSFFWLVNGKRTNIIIEPNKSDVDVKGSGPYKWI